MSIALVTQHAKSTHRIVLSSVACPALQYFFFFHIFSQTAPCTGKKTLLNVKCVFFIFSTNFVWNTFHYKNQFGGGRGEGEGLVVTWFEPILTCVYSNWRSRNRYSYYAVINTLQGLSIYCIQRRSCTIAILPDVVQWCTWSPMPKSVLIPGIFSRPW